MNTNNEHCDKCTKEQQGITFCNNAACSCHTSKASQNTPTPEWMGRFKKLFVMTDDYVSAYPEDILAFIQSEFEKMIERIPDDEPWMYTSGSRKRKDIKQQLRAEFLGREEA